MIYIDENDLEDGKYYICKTYNGDYIVLQYRAPNWSCDIEWEQIRYVIMEFNNLESVVTSYCNEIAAQSKVAEYRKLRDDYIATKNTDIKTKAINLAKELSLVSPNFEHKLKMDVFSNLGESI